jgi:hypothetical protein
VSCAVLVTTGAAMAGSSGGRFPHPLEALAAASLRVAAASVAARDSQPAADARRQGEQRMHPAALKRGLL